MITPKEAAQIALKEQPGMVVEQMRKFGDTYVVYIQEEGAGKDDYLYDSYMPIDGNTGEETMLDVWSKDYIKMSRQIPAEEYN